MVPTTTSDGKGKSTVADKHYAKKRKTGIHTLGTSMNGRTIMRKASSSKKYRFKKTGGHTLGGGGPTLGGPTSKSDPGVEDAQIEQKPELIEEHGSSEDEQWYDDGNFFDDYHHADVDDKDKDPDFNPDKENGSCAVSKSRSGSKRGRKLGTGKELPIEHDSEQEEG